MKKLFTPDLLGAVALSAMLAAPVQAADGGGDCNLTFTLEYSCYALNLGWGLATDIDGAITPYEYLWSNGATTQFVDGLGNGDHWVQITDAAGCHHIEHFNLDCDKDHEDCNLSFDVEYACYGLDLGYALATNIMNATPQWDYLWSTGATSQFVDGLVSGDYWVMITDANGCVHKEYFSLDCTKDHEPCQLRTQTPGGWGAPAAGNNPGAYRNANFAAAFPAGLTIGCGSRTLKLTSAAAVQAFLPSGTQPRMLNPGHLVDPGNSYRNVLAGHLVALTLSVGFDANDPDFGSGGSLADAVINTGMFSGWTVQQLLVEANNIIGNCGSSYSASQILDGLSLVNENFVDGTTDKGKLDCAAATVALRNLMNENVDQLLVYPNPATDRIMLDIATPVAGNVSITMIDAVGRTVSTSTNMYMPAGDHQTITLGVSQLQNGSYFVRVDRNGELMEVKRVVVSH